MLFSSLETGSYSWVFPGNYLSSRCTQRELGHRFTIHCTTVCRIINTWTNVLFCLLWSVSIWMTPGKIGAHLPHDFRDYVDTRVIINCRDVQYQTSPSVLLQSEVFSHSASITAPLRPWSLAWHHMVLEHFVSPPWRPCEWRRFLQAIRHCASPVIWHGCCSWWKFPNKWPCALRSPPVPLPVKWRPNVSR